jgi:dihydrofolate synthase/folylpolyglutamate synthase
MGFYPTTHCVFGAMGDKDLDTMLARLGPLVERWYFCDLPTPRAETAAALQARWAQLPARQRVTAGVHPGPRQALEAAVAAADPADRIVVCGSFFTVGGILEGGMPRLQAQHLRT